LGSLQFAQWNGILAAGFDALPGAAIPAATILPGGGAGGSARVRITFPDNTLQNTWLRVTVLAGATTGLTSNDVFYFGNVIGDLNIGNTATRLRVNGQDTGLILGNQSTAMNSAGVSNIFDLNRDGRVNGQDTGILLDNQRAGGIVAPITAPSITPSLAPSMSSFAASSFAAPLVATASPSAIKDPVNGGDQVVLVTKSVATPEFRSPRVALRRASVDLVSNTVTQEDRNKDASKLKNVDNFFAVLGRSSF